MGSFACWLVCLIWGWGRVIIFFGWFFEGFILAYSFIYVFPDVTWSKNQDQFYRMMYRASFNVIFFGIMNIT